MHRLGAEFEHAVVAADGRTGAAQRTPVGIAIHALRRPAPAWRQLCDLLAVTRRSGPDLVLTYNWGGMLGAVAARMLGIPFVHHEEVVPPEERMRVLRRRDWLRRITLPHACCVVVPSQGMGQRAVHRWRIPRSRVVRIDNGVDLTGRSARAHAPIVEREPVVGTVAHARVEKNWPRMLRVFAALAEPRARLVLVGDGPERAAAARLAGHLGIADRVRMCGAVQDPRPWFDAMDVFALASDDEQMPLAVIEAMAHGLPVVATDVGDVAAMLPPEQREFVVPLGPDADATMTRAIDRLLADASLRARLGAANRQHVEREYELDGVSVRYADVYRRNAAAAEAFA
ncbi:MAG: glycosyltransferase family 4 protein [Planctomycetes bacterium]|nr:glycosyltransferase family 4 protein [Planctomycetota bacterium]